MSVPRMTFGLGLTVALLGLGSFLHPVLSATVPGGLDQQPSLAPPSMDIGPGDPMRPRAPASGPRGNPLWAIPLSSLKATRERPIFLPSRRYPMPAVAGPPPARPEPPPPAEPERPQLSLVGMIANDTTGFGVFVDDSTREVIRIKTGESRAGWKLVSIQGREVTFRRGEKIVVLALPPRAQGQGQAQGEDGSGPPPTATPVAWPYN